MEAATLQALFARKLAGEKVGDLAREMEVSVQKLNAEFRRLGPVTPTATEPEAVPVEVPAEVPAELPPVVEVTEPEAVVPADEPAAVPAAPVAETLDAELVAKPQKDVKWLKAVVGDKTVWLTDRQRAGLRLIAQGGEMVPADLGSQLRRKLLVAEDGVTGLGREVLAAVNAA